MIMTSILHEYIPRFLPGKRRRCAPTLSPLMITDGRRGFSYYKLPPQVIKLSVLKLDGSCFDVQVAMSATVSELKQAVEDVFTLSPREGQGNISWSHVWGHFCLTYQDYKLVDDKDSIRHFRIKDGDQLCFIRHMSVNYKSTKRRSRNQNVACKQHTVSSPGLNGHEEIEETGEGEDEGYDEQENFRGFHYENEDQNFIGDAEFKLAHFLRGWLSYSRLWSSRRMKSETKIPPSMFARHCLSRVPRTTLATCISYFSCSLYSTLQVSAMASYGQTWSTPYGKPQQQQQWGDPFASLLPSTFPPGTDPKVVQCFRRVDQDDSGFIDDKELKSALSTYNGTFSMRTVRLLMYSFTNSNARRIGPKEFIALFNSLQNWRAIFQKFDTDRSGNIDSYELREALTSLGYTVSPTIVDLLVTKFDKSGGKQKTIDYDNFIECCITVKGLVDKFKGKDFANTGCASFSLEDFIVTVLPFIVA